jgi:hypothetical protein
MPRPPVAEAVAVVAAGNNVQQAAGRPVVRVVVDREHPPEGVDAGGVRIPKSCRPQSQVGPVGLEAEQTAAFAAA